MAEVGPGSVLESQVSVRERGQSPSHSAPPSLRASYDLWAETYPPVAHNALMAAEQAVVMRHLSAITPGRALDVGTGSGRYAALLNSVGASSVVGADLSMGMLRRNACRRRVCADALSLPLRAGAFDIVNASLIVGDVPKLASFVAEMARVLASGGHLIYSDFHPDWDARGWQRTFRSRDGREHALPRASHTIVEHLDAITSAGLEIVATDDVTTPMTGSGLRRFLRPRNVPAAVVFHARKPA
jgi:ubiquinone/menaquinone biosynthesis C-methylase UbiE